MNESSNPRSTQSSVRWTEDRVERLLLSVFADASVVPQVTTRQPVPRQASAGLVVPFVAASLALTIPLLSGIVADSTGQQESTLARWIGPPVQPQVSRVELASSDESELSAESADIPSAGESDETAEAPGAAETEDSAST